LAGVVQVALGQCRSQFLAASGVDLLADHHERTINADDDFFGVAF
jgi:hypothetical protein